MFNISKNIPPFNIFNLGVLWASGYAILYDNAI